MAVNRPLDMSVRNTQLRWRYPQTPPFSVGLERADSLFLA